jgi:hypothetical protein
MTALTFFEKSTLRKNYANYAKDLFSSISPLRWKLTRTWIHYSAGYISKTDLSENDLVRALHVLQYSCGLILCPHPCVLCALANPPRIISPGDFIVAMAYIRHQVAMLSQTELFDSLPRFPDATSDGNRRGGGGIQGPSVTDAVDVDKLLTEMGGSPTHSAQ